MIIKTCSNCNEEKDIEEFYSNKNGLYGKHSHCKVCQNKNAVENSKKPEVRKRLNELKRLKYLIDPEKEKEKARIYREMFKDRVASIRYKASLKRKFGMSLDDYFKMVEEHGNVCAICKLPQEYKLCVDHNHTTGKVRGLLCHQCNTSIGMLKENIENLNNAITYLKKYEEK